MRLLGSLMLVVLLLAGCGEDASSTPDPAGTASEPESPESPEAPEAPEVVALLHDSAVGGTATEEFTDVTGPDALSGFAAQFSADDFVSEVGAAVRRARSAHESVQAAVVAVGCDVPPGVRVVATTAGAYAARPAKVVDPLPNCFAPVTTVAVIGVG